MGEESIKKTTLLSYLPKQPSLNEIKEEDPWAFLKENCGFRDQAHRIAWLKR